MVPLTETSARYLLRSAYRTGLIGVVLLTAEPTEQTDEGLYRGSELWELSVEQMRGKVRVTLFKGGWDEDTVELSKAVDTEMRCVTIRPATAARGMLDGTKILGPR